MSYIHSNKLKIFCKFWKSIAQLLTRFLLWEQQNTEGVISSELAVQIHIKESTHGWLNITEPSEPS